MSIRPMIRRSWISPVLGAALVSLAAILGGGEFTGGRVAPIGAVIDALAPAMAASPLLTFLRIPPDCQVAANGAILITTLAARIPVNRKPAAA